MVQSSAVNQPVKVPLVSNIRARHGFLRRGGQFSEIVDPQLINCYAEYNPEAKSFTVQKRPGYSEAFFEPAAGEGLGLFQFVPDAAGNPVTNNDSFVVITGNKAYLIYDIDDIGMSCTSIELGAAE